MLNVQPVPMLLSCSMLAKSTCSCALPCSSFVFGPLGTLCPLQLLRQMHHCNCECFSGFSLLTPVFAICNALLTPGMHNYQLTWVTAVASDAAYSLQTAVAPLQMPWASVWHSRALLLHSERIPCCIHPGILATACARCTGIASFTMLQQLQMLCCCSSTYVPLCT